MSESLRNFIGDSSKAKYSVIGPISTKAKLTLTPSPEKLSPSYSHPAQIVDIEMPDLTLSVSKQQYNDMAKFGERIGRVYENLLKNKKALMEGSVEEEEETVPVQVVTKTTKKTEQQVPPAQQPGGGWFSGWSSWLTGAAPVEEQLDDATIEEEKTKLYEAIDYHGEEKQSEYPDTYEKFVANFRLGKVELNLVESPEKEKILGVVFNNFVTA